MNANAIYIEPCYSEMYRVFIYLVVILMATSFAIKQSASRMAAISKFPYPSYFFSHGGPTFIYEDDPMCDAGAFKTTRGIGNHIKNDLKPDYIVVVSAHWQSSGENRVDIGVPDKPNGANEVIYDFYGFPKQLYQEKFVLKSSSFVANKLQAEFQRKGFTSNLVKRGIDHGVWVPFRVAFLDKNSSSVDLLDIPLVQVSLTSRDEDFDTHYKLGKVLSHFRENPIYDEANKKELRGLVIFSGMSVHNLPDLRYAWGSVRKYAKDFNGLLRKILVNDDKTLDRLESLKTQHKSLLYQAHPTLEHFVPLVAACGVVAEKEEPITELYNNEMASAGWGIYQFGK